MTARSITARRRESGTAALEIVGLLPLLFVVALLVTQVGLAGYTAVSADRAARAAARAATLDRDATAAANGAVPGTLSIRSVTSLPSAEGVRYRVTLAIPVLGLADFGSISREAEFPRIS